MESCLNNPVSGRFINSFSFSVFSQLSYTQQYRAFIVFFSQMILIFVCKCEVLHTCQRDNTLIFNNLSTFKNLDASDLFSPCQSRSKLHFGHLAYRKGSQMFRCFLRLLAFAKNASLNPAFSGGKDRLFSQICQII